MANQASTVQFLGDVSAPSRVQQRRDRRAQHRQAELLHRLRAGRVARSAPKATLNYGLRYDYYTPLREANNLIVKFNIDTGVIDPEHDARCTDSKKNNFQPRVSFTYAPGKTGVPHAASASSSARARPRTRSSPVESDRVSSTHQQHARIRSIPRC